MSRHCRFIGWVIGFASACAVLLMPLSAGMQTPPRPPAARAVQAPRVQIPADGRVLVMRSRPGQPTHLIISVANGGLADGQSEPTPEGKAMIARFVASLREVDQTLESYVFLVRSYSSPKAAGSNTGERGQGGAAAAASTAVNAPITASRTAAAAAAAAGGVSATAARRTPQSAVSQPQSARGSATAPAQAARGATVTQAATPQVLQKMRVVTVRGAVQTGLAAAVQRQLINVEKIAADRIRLYAHGESRPETPQPDAPPGDYVRIDVHRLMAMMSGPPPPEAQAMTIEAGDVTMPAFAWPPPRSTSQINLMPEWLRLQNPPTLGQVGNLLVSALQDARYPHHAYLAVPNGFALVAQLEQIQSDGTPVTPNRWDNALPSMANMGFLEFLRALVVAPTGHYRVIAFIVTDVPWQQSAPRPTEEQAQQWLSTGLNALPAAVRDMPYTTGYQSTALVYQFAKDANGPRFVDASTIDTLAHLDKAGLLRTLRR